MSIRPFVMPFRLSCAYLIYDADAALPHLNPRKRRRGGIFIYEKRDHCIISCNSLFIFLINANLLTLPTWAPLLAASGQQLATAVLRTMPHGPVMYIAIYSRRAALAGSAPTHKADGRVFCVLQNCGNRHSFNRLYAIS